MTSTIDFDVTESDWIVFQQFTDKDGISIATTDITITAITEKYISFLHALTFTDYQIEEALYYVIEDIKQRREYNAIKYFDSIKTNETTLSNFDNSTKNQAKESTETNSVDDWL